jgi:hypothetical protein
MKSSLKKAFYKKDWESGTDWQTDKKRTRKVRKRQTDEKEKGIDREKRE